MLVSKKNPKINWSDYKNLFKQNQITCKCGCGYSAISKQLMDMVYQLRLLINMPLTVTSGCRCLKHNRSIGSNDTSSHITGLAIDIAIPHKNNQEFIDNLDKMIFFAGVVGFKRIGINRDKKFIHLDVDYNKIHPSVFKY